MDIWNRKNDGDRKEERSFIRYFIVSTTIFIILVGFVNKNNIARWVRAGLQIRRQERQIERYEQDIRSMDKEINGIVNNKDSLEQFAREKFHLAAPGDEVYLDEN